jgi:hypothetical protein
VLAEQDPDLHLLRVEILRIDGERGRDRLRGAIVIRRIARFARTARQRQREIVVGLRLIRMRRNHLAHGSNPLLRR